MTMALPKIQTKFSTFLSVIGKNSELGWKGTWLWISWMLSKIHGSFQFDSKVLLRILWQRRQFKVHRARRIKWIYWHNKSERNCIFNVLPNTKSNWWWSKSKFPHNRNNTSFICCNICLHSFNDSSFLKLKTKKKKIDADFHAGSSVIGLSQLRVAIAVCNGAFTSTISTGLLKLSARELCNVAISGVLGRAGRIAWAAWYEIGGDSSGRFKNTYIHNSFGSEPKFSQVRWQLVRLVHFWYIHGLSHL